ncbi:MAG: hypothetical protein JO066_08855 [Verrucomicrobia bacterium]|nr:hypothetical protein [Verrucomicrobiota bacterium]
MPTCAIAGYRSALLASPRRGLTGSHKEASHDQETNLRRGADRFASTPALFPPRSHDRRFVVQEAAKLYGVSEQTLYRALRDRTRPKLVRRTDRGAPRILPQEQM